MDAFNAVLEEADTDLEAGSIDVVTATFAKRVLEEHVIVSDQPADA